MRTFANLETLPTRHEFKIAIVATDTSQLHTSRQAISWNRQPGRLELDILTFAPAVTDQI